MDKYIVVHSGRRDNYEVTKALLKTKRLEYLITDFYVPDWLFYFERLIPKNILQKRYSSDIPSRYVKNSLSAFACYFLYRKTGNIKFSIKRDKILGKKARKIAIKKQCNLIAMSYFGQSSFPDFPFKKILFQYHPHPREIFEILNRELKNSKYSTSSLYSEYEIGLTEDLFKKYELEQKTADHIIVTSTFTKQSLLNQGIESAKISMAKYGFNPGVFNILKDSNVIKNQLLFVGALSSRKGVGYLIEAMNSLPNFNLIIVTRGLYDKELINSIPNNVFIKRDIPISQLVELYNISEAFILPSLAEGFGQVIIESMACGLPVICTKNSIGLDIIDHGKNGILLESQSVNDIIYGIREFKSLSETIDRRFVKESISNLTWDNFHQKINTIVNF